LPISIFPAAVGAVGAATVPGVGGAPAQQHLDLRHDTLPAGQNAVLIILDLVSRKWLTEIVSVEEPPTQVELAFTAALEAEGLLDVVEARHAYGRVDLGIDDQARPILLAPTTGRR
jgi:hypothetical protein